MAMAHLQKSKFRFSEIFINTSGKTSGSAFVGIIMGLIASASFIAAIIGWWMSKPLVLEVITSVLQLGLLSAALLGVRKVSAVLNKNNVETNTETETKTETKTHTKEAPKTISKEEENAI